jgi:hypothetical protein
LIVLEGLDPASDGVYLLLEVRNRSSEAHALITTLDSLPVLVDSVGRSYTAVALSPELTSLDQGSLAPEERRTGWVRFVGLGDGFDSAQDEHRLRLGGFEDLVFQPIQLPVDPDPARLLAQLHQSTTSEAGTSGASEAPASRVEVAVRELLDRQAAAMERLDFTSYLATIHPDSREAERQVFERLRSFDLDDVALSLRSRLREDPLQNQLRAETELQYRLAELPADHRFSDRLTIDLIRENENWRVRRLRVDPRGLLFWRRGPIVVHRSTHFLIYTRPSLQSDLHRIAGEAEAGYLQILQAGLPLASKYLALVPERREFAQITGAPGALGAARSISVREGDRHSVLNRVFLLNGELFSGRVRLPEAQRRQTIAHELVHLALSEIGRPHTPAWLSEGVAVHFSGSLDFPTTERLVRSGLNSFSLARMSQPGSLGEHVSDVGLAYVYAGATVEHLVKHHGTTRLIALYRQFADRAPSGNALVDTNAALAAVYRTDLDRLDAEVKSALRRSYP